MYSCYFVNDTVCNTSTYADQSQSAHDMTSPSTFRSHRTVERDAADCFPPLFIRILFNSGALFLWFWEQSIPRLHKIAGNVDYVILVLLRICRCDYGCLHYDTDTVKRIDLCVTLILPLVLKIAKLWYHQSTCPQIVNFSNIMFLFLSTQWQNYLRLHPDGPHSIFHLFKHNYISTMMLTIQICPVVLNFHSSTVLPWLTAHAHINTASFLSHCTTRNYSICITVKVGLGL